MPHHLNTEHAEMVGHGKSHQHVHSVYDQHHGTYKQSGPHTAAGQKPEHHSVPFKVGGK